MEIESVKLAGNYVRLQDTNILLYEDKLEITAQIYIDADMIGSNETLQIVPILKTPLNHIELPCILINGKIRHRAYKQMISKFERKKIESIYNIYKEIKAVKDLQCHYHIQLNYIDWMSEAVLELYEI